MREDITMKWLLGFSTLVAVSVWTSIPALADGTTRAYNMGYVDACQHSNGRLVNHEDRYHCYPHDGGTGTDSFMGVSFVGSVPGGQIGIGGGSTTEMRFCDPAKPAVPNSFDTVFPAQRLIELVYGSSIIDAGIVEAIRSGHELALEGYAFDGEFSFKSKGVLSWLPNGVAQMKFSTNCAAPDKFRTDAINYIEELGMGKAMIIERFMK